eukprot:2902602-Pleurochrysis_carterae.AAC.1
MKGPNTNVRGCARICGYMKLAAGRHQGTTSVTEQRLRELLSGAFHQKLATLSATAASRSGTLQSHWREGGLNRVPALAAGRQLTTMAGVPVDAKFFRHYDDLGNEAQSLTGVEGGLADAKQVLQDEQQRLKKVKAQLAHNRKKQKYHEKRIDDCHNHCVKSKTAWPALLVNVPCCHLVMTRIPCAPLQFCQPCLWCSGG